MRHRVKTVALVLSGFFGGIAFVISCSNGGGGSSASGQSVIDAINVAFDNLTSGLSATDVQEAIDEVDGRLDAVEADAATHLDTTAANQTKSGALAVGGLSVNGAVSLTGALSFGSGANEVLDAGDVVDLTGGGDASALHDHDSLYIPQEALNVPITLTYPGTVPTGIQAAGWVVDFDLLPGAPGSTKTFDVFWRDDHPTNGGTWSLRFADAPSSLQLHFVQGQCGQQQGPDWPFFSASHTYSKPSGLVEIRIDNVPTGGCEQAALRRVVIVLR